MNSGDVIDSINDLIPDGWEVVGLEKWSVVFTASGDVAQVRHVKMNTWWFFDPDTGERLDRSAALEPEDFPVTVVERIDEYISHTYGESVSVAAMIRERALAKFFHTLDGGPAVLGDGAL